MASERMNPQTAKGLDQPQPVLFATFAPLRFENDRDPAARPFLAATIADHCAQPPCHPQRLEHETAKTQSAQRTQLNLSKSKQRQVTSARRPTQLRATKHDPRIQSVLRHALFATFAPLRFINDRATFTMPPLAATTTPHCETRPCHPQRLVIETAKAQRAQRTQFKSSELISALVTNPRRTTQPIESDTAPQSQPLDQNALFATFASLRLEIDRVTRTMPPLEARSAHRYETRPYHPQRLVFQTAKTQSAQRTQLNLSKSKQRQVTSQRLRPQPRETDEAPQSHPVVQNALFATFASLRLEIDRATRTRPPLEATTTPPIQPPVQNVLFATFAPLRFTSDRATHTMPTLAVKPADHHEVWLCQRPRLEIRTAKAQRAQERTPVFPPDPLAVPQEIA
jgi:hypothetical protein